MWKKIIFFILGILILQLSIAQTNYNTSTGSIGTTYSWIDCSGGTEITSWSSGNSDDGTASVTWPFAFSFYDNDYTTSDNLSVCTNGYIRLDGAASTSYGDASGYDLTSTATSLGQIIAMGIQDCNTDQGGTNVYYHTTGSSPNRIFTIEYHQLEIDYNDNKHVDIQVSFYETSNKVVIKMGADDVTKADADIGIHSGTDTYFNKWQDVDNGTNNAWIEYTVPSLNYYTDLSGNLGTTYSWIDCSSGTEILDTEWLQDIGLGDKKDDGYTTIAWPFNFQVYDSYYYANEDMYFCTNGFIRFDGLPNDDASNTYNNDIDGYSPNLGEIVAFAMEDAGLVDNISTVHYLTTGSAPNRVFTIEVQELEVRFDQEKYMDVQISFYETSNKIVIKLGSFDVPASYSTYLGIHSGNTYKHQWGELQTIGENKWIEYTPPAKSFSDITITQASTDNVYPSSDNEVLRVQFDIYGGKGAFNLTDFDITASNDANSDVTNVKLYHTSSTVFSTDHQIGSSVTISGGKYTFSSLAYNMPGGTSYIWVTYDVSSGATSGNSIDGYIAAYDISINGSTYPTSNENPSGNRNISFFKWDGSTSTDWTVGSNWTTNSVPSSSDNVIIPSAPANQPHLPSGNNGYCKDLTIESGATVTVENTSKNLRVYGNIINNGTLDVTGTYNILLYGSDNYIKGNGDYSTARLRLIGSGVSYRLTHNVSCYRLYIDDGSTINIGDYDLVLSHNLKGSSGSTVVVGSGGISVGTTVDLDAFTPGTGTFFYNGSNSRIIVNTTYYNLKVKVSSGTRTLTNVATNCKSLEIVGSGTAALDANVDIDDNYIIEAGCTVDMNGHNINLSGNWTNNGTLMPGSQTITFDGIGSSHIYGSTSFYNLTLNKSTGDLYSDGTNHITNTLALTNGVMFSSSNTAVILDAGATYTGGTDVTSYVNGPMRKDGDTDFKFPIGDFRKFEPCEVMNLSASTQFVAEFTKAGHANNTSFNYPLTKVSLNEYWNITPSAAVTADVRLYWLDGDWSGIGDLTDLRLAHYNGSEWDELAGATTSGGTSSGTITKLAVNSFSPFTFGTTNNVSNPLPVSLVSFDARKVDNTALLEWQTASEINNDYFIVQRSVDGVEIEDIGILDGNGNSNTLLSYDFVDYNPPMGNVYYRLKQVDFDGKFEVFNWRALFFNANGEISIYPNPNNIGVLYFESKYNDIAQIEIYSVDGKLVLRDELIFNSGRTNLNHDLKKGYYIVKMYQGDEIITHKLVVQ